MVVPEDKLESRIAAVEAQVSSVVSTVDKLARTVEANQQDVHDSINRLAERVSTAQKAPWGVLGTWAGVVLSAAGLIGGLVAFGLNQQSIAINESSKERHERSMESIDRLTDEFQKHVDLPMHFGAVEGITRLQEKVKSHDAKIESLDVVVQREMRLLDDALQREMRQLNDSQNIQIGHNREALAMLRSWQIEHDEKVAPLNAHQWERIEVNSREINRLRDKIDGK